MCPGQIKYVSVQPKVGITSYQWYTNDSGIIVNGSGASATVEGVTPGTYSLKIKTFNSCGSIETSYLVNVLAYGSSQCSGTFSFAVYPNPTANELTVAYQSNDASIQEKAAQEDFEVSLLDNKGKTLRKQNNNTAENKIVLDVRNIPNDTYFLHITQGKEVIKQQVIIQH